MDGIVENKAEEIGSPFARGDMRDLIRQMRQETWNPDEITKALLDDPMKVFNEVLHQDTLDNETKLDLFLCNNLLLCIPLLLTHLSRRQQKRAIERLYQANRS